MTSYHAKNARFYKDGYDLSGQSSNVALAWECPTEEDTCFTNTGQTHLAGIPGWTFTVTSFWRDASGSGTDVLYKAALGASGIYSFYPAGLSDNHAGYAVQKALETTYPIRNPVAGAVTAEPKLLGSGDIDRVRCLGASTSTASGSVRMTGYDYGASTASGALVGVLHVTAISGTDPSVVFTQQDSGDNNTYSDLFTVATATAIGATRATTTASCNRYAALKYELGADTDSITFVYGFKRAE